MKGDELRSKVDQFVGWFGFVDNLSKWIGHLYLLGWVALVIQNIDHLDDKAPLIIGGFVAWGLYQITRILSFGIAWSVVEMTMNSRAALLMGVNQITTPIVADPSTAAGNQDSIGTTNYDFDDD